MHPKVISVVKIASVIGRYASRGQHLGYPPTRENTPAAVYAVPQHHKAELCPALGGEVYSEASLLYPLGALLPQIAFYAERLENAALNQRGQRLSRSSYCYLCENIGVHTDVCEAFTRIKGQLRGKKCTRLLALGNHSHLGKNNARAH